ncbi:hypothetical protein PFLmoz3_05512 [Pseudomonas fluorescens]|uniref:Uncharacterized protein n=1 Tax=Pseudomonas fluorescens TaxID=294 RepID=A0A109LCA8_PSEFL|nr:hypothetical protein PFLmoz3_05512 [Pseudomonas fluorescens]
MQPRQACTGKNRTQLFTQQFGAFQAQADTAQAKEWVGLVFHRHIGQGFIAAHIQGTYHQITLGAEGAGDGAVGVGLLLCARGTVAFQVEELRTQQTHALSAQGQ